MFPPFLYVYLPVGATWPLAFCFVFCFALSLVHSGSLLVKNIAISEGTKSTSPKVFKSKKAALFPLVMLQKRDTLMDKLVIFVIKALAFT